MASSRRAAPHWNPSRWRVLGVAGMLLIGTGCASLRAAELYSRGTEQLEAGAFPRAIENLEAARDLAPGMSAVHNHLGIAYRAAGRDREALASFRRALELDCDNRAARENLRRLELAPPTP